ncbi:MAG TPA: Rrf2 family transcriptional regulator, partial [Solirubrobacteraceae bacterium]|nr:Rrf2 family transcriptional regulator [Solirubrobacteraceae bacterium]
MDLRLTRRGDYAVRAGLFLAGGWESSRYLKIREITSAMHLPVSYTPQILKLLMSAGLAEAKAGPDGGYRLCRPPAEITLLEVVQAAEGELVLDRCILRGGPCHWEDACAVHAAWDGVVQACRARLADTTLADLAAADAGLRAG